MDQNINQPGQGGSVPTPLPMEIDVRTMETDIKSFQGQGGEISETGIKSEYSATPEAEKQQISNISGYQGSEKPIFSPSGDILAQQGKVSETSGNSKLILMIIGILTGVIGLGLLGYYVIFPLLFK